MAWVATARAKMVRPSEKENILAVVMLRIWLGIEAFMATAN